VEDIVGARHKSKAEVSEYLFQCWAEARKSGANFTESELKTKNPIMYYAFKQYYPSLRAAFEEMLAKVQ
jgi:hypothetical protein